MIRTIVILFDLWSIRVWNSIDMQVVLHIQWIASCTSRFCCACKQNWHGKWVYIVGISVCFISIYMKLINIYKFELSCTYCHGKVELIIRTYEIWHWIMQSITELCKWMTVGFFSSPEPKAQVSYCHSAPSVVRPSVVRPSVCKLSHFQLLQNRLMDFDETW